MFNITTPELIAVLIFASLLIFFVVWIILVRRQNRDLESTVERYKRDLDSEKEMRTRVENFMETHRPHGP